MDILIGVLVLIGICLVTKKIVELKSIPRTIKTDNPMYSYKVIRKPKEESKEDKSYDWQYDSSDYIYRMTMLLHNDEDD